jgi:hypothetical protein
MRVLIASTHGAGHFGPLVPFADAYLRNGDEVLVVGPPTLEAHDYPFRAGASPPENVLAPLWATLHEQPSGQSEVIVVGTIFAELNVNAMLPAFEDAIEDWKPDLVLRETNEYASAIAAEEHGIAHVRAGKPLVVVPLFADQPHNAWRTAKVGAGVIASLATLRRQIERVLSDDSYTRAAERVAAEMRGLPPVDDFVG